MESFNNLGISEQILKAIKEQNFIKPTNIQQKSIPLILQGKDVIGGSATGSGKTLAFGCAIIQNLKRGEGIGALILTPTRELAEQVSDALTIFSKYNPLKIISIYGGVAINPQIHSLETADVVVATPGRMLDHLSRGTINLSKVKFLVLDEADRMLDMGFIDDVTKIIKRCPKERQTLLFSATIHGDLKKITENNMVNPVSVASESHVDPTKLKQVYYDVADNLKFSLLVHMLKKDHTGLMMVFCNTRHSVDFLEKNLKLNDINAISIHGGLSQAKRSDTLKLFQSEDSRALICTDVAARGLDIPNVSHVYNYDIPNDTKEYIHRIGRTARAGKEGKVINLIGSRDHKSFSDLLYRNPEIKIKNKDNPQFAKVRMRQLDRTPARTGYRQGNTGQRSGYRPGNKNRRVFK